MEAINTMLTDMLGPFGGVIAVGMLGVLMILVTAPFLLKKQDDPLDRLKEDKRSQKPEAQKLRTADGKDKLDKYANFLEPQDKEEFSAIKLKLLQAGYYSKNAVRMYFFVQFTLGVLGLLGGVAYALIKMGQGEVSTQFGTSIADALRVYAAEMRDKRVMRAEEAANKLPTKMTLATMMLTVPPLLIILIGPSIYQISQSM